MQLRELVIHGHRVGYRTAGTGPVLLLIHGMAGSATTWRHVMPALSRSFTVVAPSLPGYTFSNIITDHMIKGTFVESRKSMPFLQLLLDEK